MTGQDIFLRVSSVLVLIGINAFFVAAEFSLVSVRRSRVSQLAEAGDVPARRVQALQRSIERLLSTTQLGITLSSLALGWIGESTLAVSVKEFLNLLPLPREVASYLSHLLSLPIAFLSLAYLQIVLGELLPKSIALTYSEELARFLASPVAVIVRSFTPFIAILNCSTRSLLDAAGIRYGEGGWYGRATPEELQLMVAAAADAKGLEARSSTLLKKVFAFSELTAAEVMVPRTYLVAIPETASLEQLLQEMEASGHRYYPVMGESLDDLCGLIDFQQLALPVARGELVPEMSVAPWIGPLKFVPESTPLDELLSLMQQSDLKVVVVVDEFGGTSGLLTLKDLLAEFFQDDGQRRDAKLAKPQRLDEETFLVPAQMNLEAVNELLGLDLPLADEYQTLAGFLLYQWQKIPVQGETLIYEGQEFTVTSAEGPRLLQIRIRQERSPTQDLPPVPTDPLPRESLSNFKNVNERKTP